MTNDIISIIRTIVPMIVGSFATWLLAKYNVDVSEVSQNITAILVALLSAIYYTLVRWIETKYPKFGYLLGVAKKPEYK